MPWRQVVGLERIPITSWSQGPKRNNFRGKYLKERAHRMNEELLTEREIICQTEYQILSDRKTESICHIYFQMVCHKLCQNSGSRWGSLEENNFVLSFLGGGAHVIFFGGGKAYFLLSGGGMMQACALECVLEIYAAHKPQDTPGRSPPFCFWKRLNFGSIIFCV